MGTAWSEHVTKLQIKTCWFFTVASTYNVLPEWHSLRAKVTNIDLCKMILTLFILCILTGLHCLFIHHTNKCTFDIQTTNTILYCSYMFWHHTILHSLYTKKNYNTATYNFLTIFNEIL